MIRLTFVLRKDANSIKNYLINTDKFVEVHPLIYKMQALGEGNYKVYEKVKFGVIPYKFTYRAAITYDDTTVTIRATIMRINRITMTFSFKENDGQTTVDENITIQTPWPIRKYMHRLFSDQHELLFRAIDNHVPSE